MLMVKKNSFVLMYGVLIGVILLMVGCSPNDYTPEDDTNVGSVRSEQVVVGRERWRNFLSNVTGCRFVLNTQGLVDTIYYDEGYAIFIYNDEYRDPQNAINDMVEMKLYDINHVAHKVCSFNIGSNGYAKNATEVDLATGKDYAWRFTYDKYGYLISLNAGSDMCTFDYIDGNIVEYTNFVEFDETFYFAYSSMSSHGYMPYFHSPGYIESDFGPILPLAYLAGLAGQPSKNLPSICEREKDFEEYIWKYEYEYIFSNDGVLVGLYYQQI